MGTMLIYGLVSLVIGIAVGAGIVMLCTRIVAGFTPKFLFAAVTVVISAIAGAVASWVLGMVLGAGTVSSLIAFIVLFLVNAFVLNALIKRPAGGEIGLGKACLVTLLQIIVYIVLVVILALVFGAGMMGMMGAAAMH